MMNSFKISLSLLAASLLLAGCPKKDGPIPQDTLIGKGYNPNRAENYNDLTRNSSYNQIEGDTSINPTYSEGDYNVGLNDDFNSGSVLTSRGDGSGAFDPSQMGANANVLQSIYFGFDQYTVSESERGKLIEALDFLRNNPAASFVAAGHTDWRGTNEYNMGLGDRRASNVRSFLVELGIQAGRIEILSKGELDATEGVDKNDPQAKQDRRVDLIVIQ